MLNLMLDFVDGLHVAGMQVMAKFIMVRDGILDMTKSCLFSI